MITAGTYLYTIENPIIGECRVFYTETQIEIRRNDNAWNVILNKKDITEFLSYLTEFNMILQTLKDKK